MSEVRRVVVTGGTGLIGRRFVQRLLEEGWEVTVLSRNPNSASDGLPNVAQILPWPPATPGEAIATVEGSYAIVNLGAAPAFGHRWTRRYRTEMRQSRVLGAQRLVDAIVQAANKPKVFINASSVGAYGFTTQNPEIVTESTLPDPDDYAHEVLEAEERANQAAIVGTRVVNLRTGFVLSHSGGGLPDMVRRFVRTGQGAVGPGSQYLPWIHLEDAVGLILWALAKPTPHPVLNVTAPHVPTNREFFQTLGDVTERASARPIPPVLLRVLMGGAAIILTHGRRVYPYDAMDQGFPFRYATLREALNDLVPRITNPSVPNEAQG